MTSKMLFSGYFVLYALLLCSNSTPPCTYMVRLIESFVLLDYDNLVYSFSGKLVKRLDDALRFL